MLLRLTLSAAALDALFGMKDPSKVFAVLYELNKGENVPATLFKVPAANNLRIMEVDRHLHIGDEGKASDMGRVYFCRVDRPLYRAHPPETE